MYASAEDASPNNHNSVNNVKKPDIERMQYHFDTSTIGALALDTGTDPTMRRTVQSLNATGGSMGDTVVKYGFVHTTSTSTTDVATADYLLGETGSGTTYDAGETKNSIVARAETDGDGYGTYNIPLTNGTNFSDLFDGSFPSVFRMQVLEMNYDQPMLDGGTTNPPFWGAGHDAAQYMGVRHSDYTGTSADPLLTITTVVASNIHAMNAVTLANIQAANGITAANGEAINGIDF